MSSVEWTGGTILIEKNVDGDNKVGITINLITSPHRGSGFGTFAYRETMRSYFSQKLNGKVSCEAVSSHLFHLYMGMLPIEKKICALDLFGWNGQKAIDLLTKIQDAWKKNENYSNDYMPTIKEMIYYIRHGEKNEQKAQVTITREDVLRCKDELTQLKEKQVSYIQNRFIPNLLLILESTSKEKFPNTSGLGSVHMAMSQEGMDRWKEDIDKQKSFVPFRHLEPLRAYMNPEQLDRLDKVLSAREEKSPKRMKMEEENQ